MSGYINGYFWVFKITFISSIIAQLKDIWSQTRTGSQSLLVKRRNHEQRSLASYSSWGRRVQHDWATKPSTAQLCRLKFPCESDGAKIKVLSGLALATGCERLFHAYLLAFGDLLAILGISWLVGASSYLFLPVPVAFSVCADLHPNFLFVRTPVIELGSLPTPEWPYLN